MQAVGLKASFKQEHDDPNGICLLPTRVPCVVYELLGVPEVHNEGDPLMYLLILTAVLLKTFPRSVYPTLKLAIIYKRVYIIYTY